MAKRMSDGADVSANDNTFDSFTVENSAPQPAAEAMPQPVQERPVQAMPVRLIYVGPNVPGGILHRFQVFKGGLPPHCKDLFEKVPEIKELFVPVEKLETMRRKTGEPGTNEARLFDIVQKKLLTAAKGVK